MNSKLKKILISSLFMLSITLGLTFGTSKVSALNLVDVTTADPNNGGGVVGVDVFATKINQAYFRYDGTAQENSWLSKSGLGTPKKGALVLAQWVTANGIDRPLDWLKEYYTYSNVVTTNYYTDGDALATKANYNEMLRLASSSSQPNQLALAGGSLGIGNNVVYPAVAGSYSVAVGPFWFSGTFGGGASYGGQNYTPGMGNGSGAGANAGQNKMGSGVVFQGGRLVKSIIVDSPVELPSDQNPIKPGVTSTIQKSITDVTTNQTSSSSLKSKSSTDSVNYNLGFTYSSNNKNKYYQYAWTNGNHDAYTTKTIEQSFQSVTTIVDTLPKGYSLDGVKITTQDGRSITANKVNSVPGAVNNNQTAGTGKNIANYYVEAGTTGNKVTIQYIAGDHSQVASSGQLNKGNVEFSGKLIPTELPTPNNTNGIGTLSNTASISQTYQEYNRVHTSGGGTKPQPYNFGNEGYGSPKTIGTSGSKNSNTVKLDVQSYKLTTNYLQYSDEYKPTGNTLDVNVNGSQASKWVSPWTYPTLKTTTPISEQEVKTMDSQIYDLNLPGVITNGKTTNQTGMNSGSNNVVNIPNTDVTELTLSKPNAILSSGTYMGTWYHKVTDLHGVIHNDDQITTLADGKTSKIDVTPNQHTYTMGDSDAVLNLYYGRKHYDVMVTHSTSASSEPSNTSFDIGSNPIVSGTLNVTKSVDNIQSGVNPHVEKYIVHEGENFQYTPQVQNIEQNDNSKTSNWNLLQTLNKPHEFNFTAGSTPKVSGTGSSYVYSTIGLQYETDENKGIGQKGMITIDPDDLTIVTDQKTKGLPFELNLSGSGDVNISNFIYNNTPGFNLANYKYKLNISDGKSNVYSADISAADFKRDGLKLTKTIKGTLRTTGYSDGQKQQFKVSLTPDTSLLNDLEYIAPGSSEPVTISQTESTETDNNHPFNTYGFTSSNAVISNTDLNKDGQLNINKDKLVIKTVATRKPYTYKEYHEYWDINFPSDVNTLTGYSINGVFPIKYGVDDDAKMNPFDFSTSGQFNVKYSKGLNEDLGLLPDGYDTSKIKVDPNKMDAKVNLTSEPVKSASVNGVTTESIVPSMPDVKVEVKSGKISSDASKLTGETRDGGKRIYISNWITNVPSKQVIKFQSSSGMGQNNVTFDLSQNVTLIGYLQGHNESDTQSTDALLMQPVDRDQLFGNGRPFNYSTADETWLKNSDWYK